MKVLHLNTSDTNGGAARAAYRLHNGLRSNGVDSWMLVQNKDSGDDHVYGPNGMIGSINSRIRPRFDRLPLKRYPDRDPEIFSPAWTPERRQKQIAKHNPDIVHLHWVSGGFLRPETIAQIDVPVVWTLHDMWPFTGGCHYSKSCTKYQTECGSCPHLNSARSNDLANSVWRRKQSAWDNSDITIVSPSQWLGEQARESSLLGDMRIEVIPNCVDISLFRPRDRTDGLREFDLKNDKQYILFGSAYETHRKGGDLLLQALEQVNNKSDIILLTFGNTGNKDQEFPVPARHLGKISENKLHLLYSMADITVVPSREDNLPNIAVESIASGTPCIAFDVGGLSDIINHRVNGYIAERFDVNDLAEGIDWILDSPKRLKKLSYYSRQVGKNNYNIDKIAGRYNKLYTDLINKNV